MKLIQLFYGAQKSIFKDRKVKNDEIKKIRHSDILKNQSCDYNLKKLQGDTRFEN